MNNNEDIKIIDENIIISLLFIVSVLISIIIAYNDKLDKQKKQKLFSKKTSKTLNLSNRVFAVLLVIGFLIINYQEYKNAEKQNKNMDPYKHQIWASIASLVAGIIALYVVIENLDQNFQISNIENPTL